MGARSAYWHFNTCKATVLIKYRGQLDEFLGGYLPPPTVSYQEAVKVLGGRDYWGPGYDKYTETSESTTLPWSVPGRPLPDRRKTSAEAWPSIRAQSSYRASGAQGEEEAEWARANVEAELVSENMQFGLATTFSPTMGDSERVEQEKGDMSNVPSYTPTARPRISSSAARGHERSNNATTYGENEVYEDRDAKNPAWASRDPRTSDRRSSRSSSSFGMARSAPRSDDTSDTNPSSYDTKSSRRSPFGRSVPPHLSGRGNDGFGMRSSSREFHTSTAAAAVGKTFAVTIPAVPWETSAKVNSVCAGTSTAAAAAVKEKFAVAIPAVPWVASETIDSASTATVAGVSMAVMDPLTLASVARDDTTQPIVRKTFPDRLSAKDEWREQWSKPFYGLDVRFLAFPLVFQ